jgi:hypothetical protein
VRAAQRMSAAWLWKNVVSIAESRIVCGSGSSDLLRVHISNCLRARRTWAGNVGAIKPECSTWARSGHGANPLASWYSGRSLGTHRRGRGAALTGLTPAGDGMSE